MKNYTLITLEDLPEEVKYVFIPDDEIDDVVRAVFEKLNHIFINSVNDDILTQFEIDMRNDLFLSQDYINKGYNSKNNNINEKYIGMYAKYVQNTFNVIAPKDCVLTHIYSSGFIL